MMRQIQLRSVALLATCMLATSAVRAEMPELALDKLQPIDSTVSADEEIDLVCCESAKCCNSCCSKCFVEVDFLFLRTTTSDGAFDFNGFGAGNELDWDYEFSPRIAVGNVHGDGSGTRFRWWHFDADETSPSGDTAYVDFYTLDFEIFQQFKVACRTNLEVNAGVRYMEFSYARGGDDRYSLKNAFGGSIGAELNQRAGNGQLYARGRFTSLIGDGNLQGAGHINDMSRYQHELALGYEVNRCVGSGNVLTLGIGYEWHNWSNMIGTNDDDDDLADIGFDGFLLSLDYGW